jgi:hypothetical protein
MSWSVAQYLGGYGGLFFAVAVYQLTKSWLIVAVAVAIYVVSVEILWAYSPYVHKHEPATTAPEVVREDVWGFPD